MTVIRVSHESARRLKVFGETYDEALKALLDETRIDYNKIREIIISELAKK